MKHAAAVERAEPIEADVAEPPFRHDGAPRQQHLDLDPRGARDAVEPLRDVVFRVGPEARATQPIPGLARDRHEHRRDIEAVGVDVVGRLSAAEDPAVPRGGEGFVDDLPVERETIDVHQQGDVLLAEFRHIGVEEFAVVDPGALALVDRQLKMREHRALSFDNPAVDIVPIKRDDAVHRPRFL